MDKIAEHLRPGKEINQEIPLTPTKNRDNLSFRIDIIKINPRILNSRTPGKIIKIFGSYQKYKKRNNKENNLLRPPIKIMDKNINKEDKIIWITEISEKTLKEQTESTKKHKVTIGWKEKDETNKEKTYRLFEVDNKTPKEEIEIILITEAIKEKGKITMDIHDKMEQWEQLDYLETKKKDIWRNLEYHIRKHKGKILLGPPRNASDIKTLEELELTLNKNEGQGEKKLKIKETTVENRRSRNKTTHSKNCL